MSDKLEPCPFCEVSIIHDAGGWWHGYNDCWLSGKVIPEIIHDRWNRRSPDKELLDAAKLERAAHWKALKDYAELRTGIERVRDGMAKKANEYMASAQDELNSRTTQERLMAVCVGYTEAKKALTQLLTDHNTDPPLTVTKRVGAGATSKSFTCEPDG